MQDVSVVDVRKEISFCQKMQVISQPSGDMGDGGLEGGSGGGRERRREGGRDEGREG